MRFHETDLVASIVKESFYEFLVEFWDTIVNETPIFNWHIKYLCDELQIVAERVFAGETKEYDLVINVPPGSTKSTICSQMFPAWCWTRMPSSKFICASYAQAVALKDSIRTRDIVQSEKFQACFPEFQLREDENMKGLFVNTQMGFRLSAGIGGAVTGYHGHFLLVDDPLNPEEAYSEQELKVANRWMETTLPSRKVDKKVTPTILIQQRLHQADPTGEMLSKATNGSVKHICLPGELTERVSPKSLSAYYKDGLLDPVRLPREVLETLKKELGEYGYASQILQYPVPLSGGLFKTDKLHIVDHAPNNIVRLVRSWDKAGTEDGGAWSVGLLMALDAKGFFWILDVVRGQWGAREREEMIHQTAKMDGYKVEVLLEIEGGSGGKESGENTVRMLAGFRVVVFHPTGDKESRAYGLASQVGGGNVYVLNRSWLRDLLEEFRFFPHSKYKDQVDAASGAFNRIARKKRIVGGF